MKRSKLFLTVTTCALALVGVAATKKHHADISGYYAIGTGACTNLAPSSCTSISGSGQCTYTINPGLPSQHIYDLFTYTTGACANQVFKDPN